MKPDTVQTDQFNVLCLKLIDKNILMNISSMFLAHIHALCGSYTPTLPSLDALVDRRHVSAGFDLIGKFGHAGASFHLRHSQQGGDSTHGRAPQLLLLFKLLLHRTGLHLQVEEGDGDFISRQRETQGYNSRFVKISVYFTFKL